MLILWFTITVSCMNLEPFVVSVIKEKLFLLKMARMPLFEAIAIGADTIASERIQLPIQQKLVGIYSQQAR